MIHRALILLLALSTPATMLLSQTASPMQPANPATAPRAAPPSETLQPSIAVLKQAMTTMNIERWKASAAIRTEADANLRSVQHDVQVTLPSLLTTADADPDSVAKSLPVFRNIDALYDVMLRLDAAGRLAAPKDQISVLDQAISGLSDARRSLGDQLQSNADAQDIRVGRLQTALKAVPAPAPPPEPVACISPPVKKKKAAKASTTSTTTPASTPH